MYPEISLKNLWQLCQGNYKALFRDKKGKKLDRKMYQMGSWMGNLNIVKI